MLIILIANEDVPSLCGFCGVQRTDVLFSALSASKCFCILYPLAPHIALYRSGR